MPALSAELGCPGRRECATCTCRVVARKPVGVGRRRTARYTCVEAIMWPKTRHKPTAEARTLLAQARGARLENRRRASSFSTRFRVCADSPQRTSPGSRSTPTPPSASGARTCSRGSGTRRRRLRFSRSSCRTRGGAAARPRSPRRSRGHPLPRQVAGAPETPGPDRRPRRPGLAAPQPFRPQPPARRGGPRLPLPAVRRRRSASSRRPPRRGSCPSRSRVSRTRRRTCATGPSSSWPASRTSRRSGRCSVTATSTRRRVQDAAIARSRRSSPHADIRWNEDLIPLLSDANPRVRQLASRILRTQDPGAWRRRSSTPTRSTFGPMRDRALEGLRELGPAVHPGVPRAGQRPGPPRRGARVRGRGHDPVPGSRPALHPLPRRGRLVAARPRGAGARRAPRRARLRSAGRDARRSRSRTCRRPRRSARGERARRSPRSSRRTRRGRRTCASRSSTPSRGSRIRAVAGSPREDRPGGPGPARPGEGRAPRRSGSARRGRRRSRRRGHEFAPHDFVAAPSPTLADLLRHARAVGASDLHLSTGTIPHVRVERPARGLSRCRSRPTAADRGLGRLDPVAGAARACSTRRQQLDFCHKDPRARPLPDERLLPAQGPERRLPPGPARGPDPGGHRAARERSGS